MKISILTAAVAVALAAGCGSPSEAEPTPEPAAEAPAPAAKAPTAFDQKPAVGTKALCPVMKGEFVVSETTEFSEHEGKHYAFCCPGCKPQFDADPKKFTGG
jgi:YHS domain-containing protein